MTENLLEILLAGGLDPQPAAWASDIFVSLVTIAAREDDVRRARSRNDSNRQGQVDDLNHPGIPGGFELARETVGCLHSGNTIRRLGTGR